MPRKYTGNSDGLSKAGARPGLKKLVALAEKEFALNSLGTFANRSMNNPKATPGDPKWLSVHATGRACDLGYKTRKDGLRLWNFLIANTAALGIEEIHDYAFDKDGKEGPAEAWGRGYRCSRGEGEKGVKIYDEKDNAGSKGGKWIHVELTPEMADNAEKFAQAWNSLPKPA